MGRLDGEGRRRLASVEEESICAVNLIEGDGDSVGESSVGESSLLPQPFCHVSLLVLAPDPHFFSNSGTSFPPSRCQAAASMLLPSNRSLGELPLGLPMLSRVLAPLGPVHGTIRSECQESPCLSACRWHFSARPAQREPLHQVRLGALMLTPPAPCHFLTEFVTGTSRHRGHARTTVSWPGQAPSSSAKLHDFAITYSYRSRWQ